MHSERETMRLLQGRLRALERRNVPPRRFIVRWENEPASQEEVGENTRVWVVRFVPGPDTNAEEKRFSITSPALEGNS